MSTTIEQVSITSAKRIAKIESKLKMKKLPIDESETEDVVLEDSEARTVSPMLINNYN